MAGIQSVTSLLRKKLPESTWTSVVSALRHDPIIWEALQDRSFANSLISSVKDISDLKPSSIALSNLKFTFPDLYHAQSSTILELSTQAYKEIILSQNSQEIHTPFTTAALIALEILDRVNRQGIDGAVREVLQQMPGCASNGKDILKTSFAILYGLIPDGIKILSILLSDSLCAVGTDLAIHILLCDPVAPTSKLEILWSLLDRLPISITSTMLRKIAIHQPELTRTLSAKYLENIKSWQVPANLPLEGDPVLLFVQELSTASLYSISERSDQAIPHYEKATKLLQDLYDFTLNQFVKEIQNEQNPARAVDLCKSYKTIEASRPPSLLMHSLLENDNNDAVDFCSIHPEKKTIAPMSALCRAIAAWKNNDGVNFRRHVTDAIDIITSRIQNNLTTDLETIELIDTLPKIISYLLEYSRPADAMRAAQILTRLAPRNPEGYLFLAQSSRQAGYQDQAVEAAQLAVMLNPSEVNYRRELALCLESIGDWRSALSERLEITDPRFSQHADSEWPPPFDQFALAASALKAGDLERAEATCREIILRSEEQGPAHALLGEVLFAKGEQDSAIHHLILATQQAPNLPESWLALSRIYLQIGQTDQALEILRAASQVISYHPEIHLKLGEIFLEFGSLSEAEKALGNAFEILFSSGTRFRLSRLGGQTLSDQIKPDQIFASRGKCALLYGLTLYKLGFRDRAGKVLEQGYLTHPAYPGLAQFYGLYLIELKDLLSALESFAIATTVDPKNPECLIEYAQVLINLNKNPEIAILSLETALDILEKGGTEEFSDDRPMPENLVRPQKFVLNDLPEALRDIQWQKSIVYQSGQPSQDTLRSLALALLAKAYEIDGQLGRALKTYSKALETPLVKDEHWRMVLTMGLGQTALKNNQPEVTIASLQDLKDLVADNPMFHQILSEAYSAMGFLDEGIVSAKKAVKLAPDDIDILCWYAEKSLAVGNSQEAALILKRAVELDPSRDDLALMLGKTLINLGKLDSALEILHNISTKRDVDTKILYETAAALSSLGNDDAAASCLENALQQEKQPNPEVFIDLTLVYMKSGNYDLALRTIDRALECEPDNTDLHLRKADILVELERDQAALAILEHAQLLKPDRHDIYSRISAIYYQQGRLPQAYLSAQKSIQLFKEGVDFREEIQIRTLAASIARSLLDLETAAKLLSGLEHQYSAIEDLIHDVPIPALVNYYCLSAEIDLESNEEVLAARKLNEVTVYAGNHPRVLALKARLAYRSNDHQQARHDLDTAIQKSGLSDLDTKDLSHDSLDTLIGILLAALELNEWDIALELIDADDDDVTHPYLSLLKIKAMVLRVEFARLCEILDITFHKPAEDLLSQSKNRQIIDDFARLKKYFTESELLSLPDPIITWEARSQVCFQPSIEDLDTFKAVASGPDDVAALLTASHQFYDGETIHLIFTNLLAQNETLKNHPYLLSQYALAIHLSHNRQKFLLEAIESIQTAIRARPECPYYHVILARLQHSNGAILEALRAMETALSLWPEEVRWHAYAAELATAADDVSLAVSYLEQAISIEPENLEYLLSLGNLYPRVGQEAQAIDVLQKAIELAPAQVEPLLKIASLHLTMGNLSKAVRAAERAVALANDHVAPHLLRGEIALRMSNPRQAESCAQAAIEIKSDDPDAYHLLARALEAQGRTAEALEILENGLRLSPESLSLQLDKINLLARDRSREETLSALTDLSTKYPEEPKVLSCLAFSLAENNNREEALRVARHALRSSQDALQIQERAELHYLVGKLLEASGQLDQAIHHISEAIRYSPEDIEKYLALGKVQQASRQHLQALETYKKAISINPDNPQPYLQAGLVLKECRDYQGAENMLRRAAELAPQDRFIHRQLAALIALNLVHNPQSISKEI